MTVQDATGILTRNAMIVSELRATKGALLNRAASVIEAQLVLNESLRTGLTTAIEQKNLTIASLELEIANLKSQNAITQAALDVAKVSHARMEPLPGHNYD